jgi:benzoyl-CoA reductase/2-hydroxyglutaryl-CoA dehydratase subunit BcrC/BadD/HgdB
MAGDGRANVTSAPKATEMAKKANDWTKMMYRKAEESRKAGKPVSWCMWGIQQDITAAFDIQNVFTENYAAVAAAKQQAEALLEAAESEGYSNLICGYVRVGIGYSRLYKEQGNKPPREAPRGGMAKPSMLLASSVLCDPRYKWYQALARYQDTPFYFYDVVRPPIDQDRDDPQVRKHYIDYSISQLRDFAAFCSKQTGVKLNEDYLWEKIKIGEEVHRLWWECHELRKAVPCPMPTSDMLSCIVPGFFYGCAEESREFYKEMKEELTQRVEQGMGAVEDEKYRLVWGGGVPPWHTMSLFTSFEEKGGVFVCEMTYYPFEPYEVEVKTNDPFEYLATRDYERDAIRWRKAQSGCRDTYVQQLLDFINDYKCTGMVMHGTKSCRASTIGQIYNKNLIHEFVKVPTLFLESDMVDTRDFSRAHTEQKIDEFMVMVDEFHRNNS